VPWIGVGRQQYALSAAGSLRSDADIHSQPDDEGLSANYAPIVVYWPSHAALSRDINHAALGDQF
jgi:hypothetical protein